MKRFLLIFAFSFVPLFAFPPNYEEALDLFYRKNYTQSLQKIREVFDNYRNSLEFRLLAASNYLELNDLYNSKRHLDYALQDGLNDIKIFILYSEILSRNKNINESFFKIQQGLQNPNLIIENKNLLMYFLARLYFVNNDYNGARKVIEQIVSVSPNYIPALYLDGLIYLIQKNYDFAEVRFKSILLLESHNLEFDKKIYNNLGFIYEQKAYKFERNSNEYKKNLNLATKYYELAYVLDPEYEVAKINFNRLKLR